MLKSYRRSITLTLILVLYLSIPFFVNEIFNESLIQGPVVLVVGDFSEEGFGSLVYSGVIIAQQDEPNSASHIATRRVPVDESAGKDAFGGANTDKLDLEIQSLRSRLIKEVATHNVVAIISANNSQTARTLLQVGKAFNIPVLITVATTDQIIVGYSDIALRLIARNSEQAKAIQQWCADQNQSVLIGLVYDLTLYGTGLKDALTNKVGPDRLIPFSVNTTTDIAGILTYGQKANVEAWVVVGYRNQAIEFYAKKVALKLKGSMLFSDGAYGKWLSQLRADPSNEHQVYLSFPKLLQGQLTPANPSQQRPGLKGYAVLGFDAYHLINSAIGNLISVRKPQKYRLAQAIRDLAPSLYSTGTTKENYIFERSGENRNALFYVTPEVRHGKLP